MDHVRFSNIQLKVRGPMDDGFAREAPYPYATFEYFGQNGVPHAFYCRHARNLQFHNVQVDWTGAEGSWMSALSCDDVANIDIDSFVSGQAPDGTSPVVNLTNVRGASLRACRAPDRTGTFLQLNGRRTADITAVGNDLSRATIAFASTDDVPANALQQTGNLMR